MNKEDKLSAIENAQYYLSQLVSELYPIDENLAEDLKSYSTSLNDLKGDINIENN